MKADRRYLERHGEKWRVVVPVPRHLQKKIGATKLKKGLHTDSLVIANTAKWSVVAELKRRIAQAEHGSPGDPLLQEALMLREQTRTALHRDTEEVYRDMISERATEILGPEIGLDPYGDYVFDPIREQKADFFFNVASGSETPLDSLVDTFHSQVIRKERTKGDDVRALRYLEDWCKSKRLRPTIEVITRKVAGQFIGDLPSVSASGKSGQPLTPRTVNKYIACLSGYWKWLKKRGHVEENIWSGQSLPKHQERSEEQERAFTDEEVMTLLAGEARPALAAIMRIGALSGARIDAIVSLRVKDCQDGLFRFKAQKKEKKERPVPIHSDLLPIIDALVAGKELDDDLFPEYPPPRLGAQQERSMPAVKAFNRYRKSVGVDESRPGRRRGLVNFHSFRRWFITKAEQAGQPEHIIASVVGHKRDSMTLGLYSAGPSMDQFRACVESVRLPD